MFLWEKREKYAVPAQCILYRNWERLGASLTFFLVRWLAWQWGGGGCASAAGGCLSFAGGMGRGQGLSRGIVGWTMELVL